MLLKEKKKGKEGVDQRNTLPPEKEKEIFSTLVYTQAMHVRNI